MPVVGMPSHCPEGQMEGDATDEAKAAAAKVTLSNGIISYDVLMACDMITWHVI